MARRPARRGLFRPAAMDGRPRPGPFASSTPWASGASGSEAHSTRLMASERTVRDPDGDTLLRVKRAPREDARMSGAAPYTSAPPKRMTPVRASDADAIYV